MNSNNNHKTFQNHGLKSPTSAPGKAVKKSVPPKPSKND